MKHILSALLVGIAFATTALGGLLDDVRGTDGGLLGARRFAELVASADAAHIRGEMEPEAKAIVVRDAKWIQSVSETLADAPLRPKVSCLCCGWRTAYFFRGNEPVASIAAIHGFQLRIFSKAGGGDYPVDEAHWTAIKTMLDLMAHESPDATAESITPRGGPRVAPFAAAGRHFKLNFDAEDSLKVICAEIKKEQSQPASAQRP